MSPLGITTYRSFAHRRNPLYDDDNDSESSSDEASDSESDADDILLGGPSTNLEGYTEISGPAETDDHDILLGVPSTTFEGYTEIDGQAETDDDDIDDSPEAIEAEERAIAAIKAAIAAIDAADAFRRVKRRSEEVESGRESSPRSQKRRKTGVALPTTRDRSTGLGSKGGFRLRVSDGRLIELRRTGFSWAKILPQLREEFPEETWGTARNLSHREKKARKVLEEVVVVSEAKVESKEQ